ncbi:hypothetical protein [Rhizobium wenxiniae]|uniref:hypothetical protein n=1 Tax=Rhizobium wenxiniae TaxID=1737357 RepID=UPI003C132516
MGSETGFFEWVRRIHANEHVIIDEKGERGVTVYRSNTISLNFWFNRPEPDVGHEVASFFQHALRPLQPALL